MFSLFKNLNKDFYVYTLCSSVLASSGHHCDGVARIVLEASEDGPIFCWVIEL